MQVADLALNKAVKYANDTDLQLIVCGDTHDGKAIIRGECIKAIMDTLIKCNKKPIVIVANHDRINEKSIEHSLEFLRDIATLVTSPILIEPFGYILPYYHDPEELRSYLKTVPKESRLIIHQGIVGSTAGHYIQDKSAITKEDVQDFRVISGHYHTRQDIKCGRPRPGAVGLFSYIGNPYSLGFGEANDPEKGFQILMDDGTLEFVPTNLRKHVVIDTPVYDLVAIPYLHKPGDLLWFKCHGTSEELKGITKKLIADNYGIEDGFKLDLIPTDTETSKELITENLSQSQIFDNMVDSLTNTSDERKLKLKSIWKDLIK